MNTRTISTQNWLQTKDEELLDFIDFLLPFPGQSEDSSHDSERKSLKEDQKQVPALFGRERKPRVTRFIKSQKESVDFAFHSCMAISTGSSSDGKVFNKPTKRTRESNPLPAGVKISLKTISDEGLSPAEATGSNAEPPPLVGVERVTPRNSWRGEERITYPAAIQFLRPGKFPTVPTDLSSTGSVAASRGSRPTWLGEKFEPSNWDVICGRGKHSYRHIGNRRFRVLIARKLPQYVGAKSFAEKAEVVNSVVCQIYDASPVAGFVRSDSKGNWYEIGPVMARQKVAHTFRDSMTGPLRRFGYATSEQRNKKLIEAQDALLRSCKIYSSPPN